MKLVYNNTRDGAGLVLEAETLGDVVSMIHFHKNGKSQAPNDGKRKKYIKSKTCWCGAVCKGGTGLASHMRSHERKGEAPPQAGAEQEDGSWKGLPQ